MTGKKTARGGKTSAGQKTGKGQMAAARQAVPEKRKAAAGRKAGSETLLTLFRANWPGANKNLLETPDGRRMTYGEFQAFSGRIANVLHAHGVQPGDRVAVQVEKSPEALALYFACIRSGAVYLPLNTAYTLTELEYFIGDAEPKLVVCRPKARDGLAKMLAARFPGVAVETLNDSGESGSLLDRASKEDFRFSDHEARPDDLASILYTSGTTGRAKGAMLTHGNLASNAKTLRDYWHITADDVLLHALPIYHTHGLFVAANTTLAAGASMLFLPKFDMEQVLRLLPRATTMMGVPTFYTRLLEDPRFNRDLASHMRLFVAGSAPLLAATHDEFKARTGHAILERYGMTETCMNASNPYEGDRTPGAVGFPLPGVEIEVRDPQTGKPLKRGEVGMIEVKGPNVFKGYWRMPDKTAEELRADGFFITGDLGQYDEKGYLRIVGRGKDLIITGGFNVYPKEIELAIDAIEGVKETAVIGLPHPDFGEGVAAVVVAEPGAKIKEAEIQRALSDKLAKFKQPKRVFVVAELPRNTMGKVQKNVLRERYGDTFTAARTA